MKTILQTRANNLEASLDYYTKLDFEIVEINKQIFATDGKAIIYINPELTARVGIRLYGYSVNDVEAKFGHLPIQRTSNGYILCDPSGTWIYLVEENLPFDFEVKAECTSLLGNFMGTCIETVKADQSIELFTQLGFERSSPDWPTYSDPKGTNFTFFDAGNCPHLFFNPALTYFNGKKNPEIIEQIRKRKLPITEEITHFNKEGIVDNIVLRDPAGLGFLIFND